jgi:hypothetical protein
MYNLKLFYFTDKIIGTYVPQGTIYLAFIAQVVIIYTTLRTRGVANLKEQLIPATRYVTMRMFRQNLTGMKKGWCHAQKLVIISLVFTDPAVTCCIVLINLNAANCRPWKIMKKSHNALNMFLTVTFLIRNWSKIKLYTC